MAQRRAKAIEDREEARQHRKAPQPSYDQREEVAVPEENWIGTADAMLILQQSYGNRYVQQVMGGVQAKLVVNPPDDQYEREADRVADAVTRASAPIVRRQVDEEESVVAKRAFAIQCQEEEYEEEEEEELVQTKPVGKQATVVSEDLEAGINAARGGGQSLPDSVRSSLEIQLGHDFSQVHVHTDAKADELSQRLGAKAFTTGSDVFFRGGAYQPGAESGQKLIAHELTHVLQQGAATVSRQAERHQSPNPERINACYLMGKEGRFYERALAFATAYYKVHNLVHMKSLAAIMSDLKWRASTQGGKGRIGQVIIISHANEKGQLFFPLTDGDNAQWLEPGEITRALSKDFEKKHLMLRFHAREVASASDLETRIVVKGCNLGKSQEALDALRQLFGGEATVTAPKTRQSFEARASKSRDPEEVINWMVKNGFVPPQATEWTGEDKRNYVDELLHKHGYIPTEKLKAGKGWIEPSSPRYQQHVGVSQPEGIQKKEDRVTGVLTGPAAPCARSQGSSKGEESKAVSTCMSRLQSQSSEERVQKLSKKEEWGRTQADCVEQDAPTTAVSRLEARRIGIEPSHKLGGLKNVVQLAEELSLWERTKKWAFEKALAAAGVSENVVMGLISKGRGTFMTIIENPGRFANTLIRTVGQGFRQFADNIGEHLKVGLLGWLFGSMSKAGVQLPKDFSLKGILQLVLQVLGITAEGIRAKAVKIVGEKNTRRIEKVWAIVSTLMKEGIGGLWEMLKDHLADLKDIVIEGIKSWLISAVIKAAALKVISMFNPVSGLINIVMMIYNVVKFLVEKARQIAGLFQAIAGSVMELATGNIGGAANKIEQALARLIPIVIGFMASLLGIGGITDKIWEIVKRVQGKVDKAIDRGIGRVAGMVREVVGRGKGALAATGAGEVYEKGRTKAKELYGRGKEAYAAGKAKALEGFEKGKAKAGAAFESAAVGAGLVEGKKTEPAEVIAEVKKVIAAKTMKPFKSLAEAQSMVAQVLARFQPEGLRSLRLVPKKGKEGIEYEVEASASPVTDVGDVDIEPKVEYEHWDDLGRELRTRRRDIEDEIVRAEHKNAPSHYREFMTEIADKAALAAINDREFMAVWRRAHKDGTYWKTAGNLFHKVAEHVGKKAYDRRWPFPSVEVHFELRVSGGESRIDVLVVEPGLRMFEFDWKTHSKSALDCVKEMEQHRRHIFDEVKEHLASDTALDLTQESVSWRQAVERALFRKGLPAYG